MGPHHSWNAVQALVNRLKTIQGGPTYWTTLEDRVFTRSWLPDDEGIPDMPYLSVLLEQPGGSFVFDEGSIVRDSFRISVVGYVAETSEDQADTTAVEGVMKLKDDVIKALMSDWKLGGAVETCKVIEWDAAAGDDPELPYGELSMLIELHLHLAQEGFGP